jgi:CheY-like chemotaxis protein
LLQTTRVHLHGRRALIVEDNQRIRAFLWQQLEAWGVNAIAVDSSQAALDALRQWDRFDFAILDSHLPDMTVEAIARAIQNEAAQNAPPLIALSLSYAAAAPEQAPFRVQLLKPVRQAQLHEAIMAVLGSAVTVQKGSGLSGLNTALAAQYPLHVLVVDDNAVNRKVAEATLTRMGYQPELAEDGREAVDQVEQAEAAGRPFDLVFMDVQMPVLDGLEATRMIKAAPGGLPPIIIAMTAAASVDDRSNCFYAGMDDYVSKPINFKEFQATIERWGGRMLHKRH